ncbi:uncharacterized protein hhla2b.2 isoform X2 [Electrophorus electricus]|nr:uncharacterized protein hhla2b.2 isoform X2 [Electrophorus electricus]
MSSYHDIIHWHKINSPSSITVHSFYNGADQLKYQNTAYSGRTSLFSDQISTGNASLVLRGVTIQDLGIYKCYTASQTMTKEAFVILIVEAPVEALDIRITDDGITCNISKVYPKPRIFWYVDKQEKEAPEHPVEDSQGLFYLTSTVKTQASLSNHTYTCSVSLGDKTPTYTGSLKQEKIEIYSGEDVAVQCPVSQGDSGKFNLTLTFEDSSIIPSYNSQGSQPHPSWSWRGPNVSVTQEGTIILHHLDREKHTGTYTCERVTPQSRQLVQTSVQIKTDIRMAVILVCCTTAPILIGVCIFCVLRIKGISVWDLLTGKKKKKKSSTTQNGNEEISKHESVMQPLSKT